MQLINTSAELKKAIQKLELRQADKLTLLKEAFLKTAESSKLINMIKSTFNEAIAAPDLKTGITNSTIG